MKTRIQFRFMLFIELLHLFCLSSFIKVPFFFFFVECSCQLESPIFWIFLIVPVFHVNCMLCLNVWGCRFNIFGNNISKSMFSTSHYIISRTTQSHAVLLSAMLSVISWLRLWLSCSYYNIGISPWLKNIFPFCTWQFCGMMFWHHAEILFFNTVVNDCNIYSWFFSGSNIHWMWQNGHWLTLLIFFFI